MTHTKRGRFALMSLGGVILVLGAALAQGKHLMDSQTLTVGTAAPAFTLPDQDGKKHKLSQDKGKVVLLAFYPADFTGGCTMEAHSLTAADKDLQSMGVQVYGVSVQDSKSHKGFCTKEGIPYTLLADTKKSAAKSYGVYLAAMGGIANRVTYIIGKDGKVVYVDKDVNSHLSTCGDDWVKWLKAHPDVTGTPATTAAPATTATLGQPAPTFALPDAATGAVSSLADLSTGKKATVVMFIATRCPVSNAYDDRMASIAKQYMAKDVAFVAINANTTEPIDEVASHAKAHNFPFPVLKDADDKIANAYAANVTPETYVLNSQGILVYHGRIDNSQDPSGVTKHDLAEALDETLAGQPVAKAETKAFGCSIKRAEQ